MTGGQTCALPNFGNFMKWGFILGLVNTRIMLPTLMHSATLKFGAGGIMVWAVTQGSAKVFLPLVKGNVNATAYKDIVSTVEHHRRQIRITSFQHVNR